ncbi:hypothetical protein Tco_1181474 [Tanacetum coccineum]
MAPTAILHHREGKLEDIVEWDLWKQIDPQSFKVFSEIAYNCLNEERSQRPNINEIVPKLEKSLELACENRPSTSEVLAPTAILHHREGKLEDIVEWDLWKQIDPQSFKVFTEIAYDCLNEERSQRPNINEIVPKLEKSLELVCENRAVRPLLFSSIFLS